MAEPITDRYEKFDPPVIEPPEPVNPLEARVEVLEATIARMLKHMDPSGTSRTLFPEEPTVAEG